MSRREALGNYTVFALGMPTMRPPASAVPKGKRKFLHRAGIRPGVILALSASGYAGFSAFVPLYVDTLGMSGAGVVFARSARGTPGRSTADRPARCSAGRCGNASPVRT